MDSVDNKNTKNIENDLRIEYAPKKSPSNPSTIIGFGATENRIFGV